MAVVKFLKNFFAVIFTFVFGILLLLLMFIIFAKGILNETNIDKYFNSTDIFEIDQSEVLRSNNNNSFGDQIIGDLLELGISERVTSNILKSNELDKIISKYVYDYTRYVLFYGEMPILSSNEIIMVIDSESSKLIGEQLTPEQELIINNYIVSLVNKVNAAVPTNQELINIGYNMDLIKMICSISFSVEAIAVIIMCLVLMILLVGLSLCNLFKLIRNISISILLVGTILAIGALIEVKVMNMLINGEGIVETMILMITSETFKDLFVYGISLVVVGVILLIISIIFIKKPKKDKMDFVEHVKEKRSLVKEQLKEHIALSDDDIDKIDNTFINKEKEIENATLPIEKVDEKQEKISIDNQNEIPKINMISEFVEEKFEEVRPTILEEKVDITELETEIKKTNDNSVNNTIVVADESLNFLKKYGFNIINLTNNGKNKESNIEKAKSLMYSKDIDYIFVMEHSKNLDIVKTLTSNYSIETLTFRTIETITEEDVENNDDYLSIMHSNIDLLKQETYK